MKEFVFDLQWFAAIIMGGGSDTLVKGTDGPDQISYSGDRVTIKAFDANDKIESSGQQCSINAGKGNDNITSEGDFTTIDAGDGRDNIINYGMESSLNGGADSDTISNTADLVTIIGGSDDDSIMNDGQKALILSGAGNDYIFNDVYTGGSVASKVTINAGDGNDYIQTYEEGNKVSINGGSGKDTILNGSEDYGAGKSATLIGGKGDDLIINYGGENALFKYSKGDGNDTIRGFNASSTLKIGNGKDTYSKETLESDLIITVGKGKITLVGAADLESVNIAGKEVNENSWKLNGTTATYGTPSKTLITVKGVKSLEGLSLKGKVVTIAKASLNATKVTINDGYTLALADDVKGSSTKKATWSLSDSTATYKSSYKTAGYKLASNGKSISYTKATKATDLATITGVKSKSGLSVSGNKITLKKSTLKSKVTVGGKNYEFDFASDYNSAKISGSSNVDIITTRGNKLSISGGAGNDTIKVLGSATSVSGGDGDDIFIINANGSNIITDYKAGDKISITSGTATVTTSGNDVVFNVGFNKILTVTGGRNENITYFDDAGEHTHYSYPDGIISVKSAITLTADYEGNDVNLSISNNKFNTLNATEVIRGLKITGNKNANNIVGSSQDDIIDGGGSADMIDGGKGNDSIIGGKGNDTLTGGDGSDVFIYNKGDGNDLITDYAAEDVISIKSGKATVSTKKDDVILTVGSNKITVVGGKYEIITYVDSDGTHTYQKIFTTKGNKTITLTEEYTKNNFNVADYGSYNTIDASAVTHSMSIVGNKSANSIMGTTDEDTIDGGAGNDKLYGKDGNDSIIGGKGKDSLYGGDGNDTLWGGTGNDYLYGGAGVDIFVYNSGDEIDTIFDYEQGVDKIMILSDEKPILVDNPLSNDATFKVGDGKIVIEDGIQKTINFIDGKSKPLAPL